MDNDNQITLHKNMNIIQSAINVLNNIGNSTNRNMKDIATDLAKTTVECIMDEGILKLREMLKSLRPITKTTNIKLSSAGEARSLFHELNNNFINLMKSGKAIMITFNRKIFTKVPVAYKFYTLPVDYSSFNDLPVYKDTVYVTLNIYPHIDNDYTKGFSFVATFRRESDFEQARFDTDDTIKAIMTTEFIKNNEIALTGFNLIRYMEKSYHHDPTNGFTDMIFNLAPNAPHVSFKNWHWSEDVVLDVEPIA